MYYIRIVQKERIIMAYMSQEKKTKLAPAIKEVLKKYGVKGSISVNNHSSLVVTIQEGVLDLIGQANADNKVEAERRGQMVHEIIGSYQVNPYYAHETGNRKNASFFKNLIAAMKGTDWYNDSDAQTDYFNTAYYIDINVGKWNKPYKFVA
jgi:hypothetical protein